MRDLFMSLMHMHPYVFACFLYVVSVVLGSDPMGMTVNICTVVPASHFSLCKCVRISK